VLLSAAVQTLSGRSRGKRGGLSKVGVHGSFQRCDILLGHVLLLLLLPTHLHLRGRGRAERALAAGLAPKEVLQREVLHGGLTLPHGIEAIERNAQSGVHAVVLHSVAASRRQGRTARGCPRT